MFDFLPNVFRLKKDKNSVIDNLAFQGIRGKIVYRDFVKNNFKEFVEQVVDPKVSNRSFTIAVITDTHAKDTNSTSFYGINGLMHTQELNILDKCSKIDMKAHLGDAIDGSDTPENSKTLLRMIVRTLNNSNKPFALVKGNHDDNDKFDEHTISKKASFGEDTYKEIVNPSLYNQPQIQYISEDTGVFYFDKGAVRTIYINTSDVPYLLTARGIKKYDIKKVRAIRQQQFDEVIEILQNSSNKKIAIFGHAPLLDAKGENGLTYNGRTMHELLVAFNNNLKGEVDNGMGDDFKIKSKFDFSEVKNSKIIAYICGHKHIETNYRYDDIDYVLLNCSALMGKNHGLTTQYNKTWDRKLNHVNEFAGYVVDIDSQRGILSVFGFGSASKQRVFEFK